MIYPLEIHLLASKSAEISRETFSAKAKKYDIGKYGE